MAAGTLTIDLDALARNWRALDAASGPEVTTGAVVKAGGYGLGVAQVATRLAAEGVGTFFVATAGEGAELRHAIGPAAEICVFSGHMAGDTDAIATHALTPMLNSVEQLIHHFEALPGHPFGVQLDSGMNRLGMEPAEWEAVRAPAMEAGPTLLMSHLACADEPDHPMNAAQLKVFREITDGLGVRRSLAATGGILLGPEYHFDLTRPGVGLYGGAPFADAAPVVHLALPVIQVRDLAAGEVVGYGATYTAETPRRIATLAAGYADGILRTMSGKAQVFAGDTACPLAGRVSMDLLTVDVSHLDKVPEALDLLSHAQGVDAVADAAGTIGYEILTSLGPRYQRHYIGAAA